MQDNNYSGYLEWRKKNKKTVSTQEYLQTISGIGKEKHNTMKDNINKQKQDIDKLIDSFYKNKETGKPVMKRKQAIECTRNMLQTILEVEDERSSTHIFWNDLRNELGKHYYIDEHKTS